MVLSVNRCRFHGITFQALWIGFYNYLYRVKCGQDSLLFLRLHVQSMNGSSILHVHHHLWYTAGKIREGSHITPKKESCFAVRLLRHLLFYYTANGCRKHHLLWVQLCLLKVRWRRNLWFVQDAGDNLPTFQEGHCRIFKLHQWMMANVNETTLDHF